VLGGIVVAPQKNLTMCKGTSEDSKLLTAYAAALLMYRNGQRYSIQHNIQFSKHLTKVQHYYSCTNAFLIIKYGST